MTLKNMLAGISLVVLTACGGGVPSTGDGGGGNTPIGVFAGLDSFGNGLGSDGGSAGLGGGDAGADGTGGEGKPFPFAAVTLTDAAGKSVTAKTNAAGYYQAKITGFAAPLVASATSGSKTYYSFTTIAPKADGFITINITGLTDKLASDVAAAAGKTSSSAITPAIIAANPKAVEAAYTSLRAVLSAQLSANSLTVATFDPVTLPFLTNGKGYDAVLDTTLVTKTGTGTTQITPNGQAPAPGLDTSGIAVFVNEFNRLASSAAGIASADFANVWDVAYLDGTSNQTIRLADMRSGGRTYAIVLPSFYDCVAATSVCKFNATVTYQSISGSGTGTFSLLADSVKLSAGVWRLFGSQDAARSSAVGGTLASGGSSSAVTSTNMYASGNIPVSINASNFAAFSGSSFAFSGGVPQLGTTGATQVTLGTSAGSPTFAIASASGNASGSLGFGSCIFNVASSTFPATHTMALGSTVTVPTCSVNLFVNGMQAGTSIGGIPVNLFLGTAISTTVYRTLSLSPIGVVTLNGVALGTVPLSSTIPVVAPVPTAPVTTTTLPATTTYVAPLPLYEITQSANRQTTYFSNLPPSLYWNACIATNTIEMITGNNDAFASTQILGGNTNLATTNTPLPCNYNVTAGSDRLAAVVSAPSNATPGQAISATFTFSNAHAGQYASTVTGVTGFIRSPSGIAQSFSLPDMATGTSYTTVTTYIVPALSLAASTVTTAFRLTAPMNLIGSKYKSAKFDYYGTLGAPLASPLSLFKMDTKSVMPCMGYISIDDGNPTSCASSILLTDSFAVPLNNDFATGSVTLKITLFEGIAYSGTPTVTLQPFNQRLFISADAANFTTVSNPSLITAGAVDFTSTAALTNVSIAASKFTITTVVFFTPLAGTVTNTLTQVTSSVPGASWFNTTSSTPINGLNGNITLVKALAQCTASNPSNPSFCAQYTGTGNPQFTTFNTNAVDASGRQFSTSFTFPYISY